jgi:hypothetical protein
VIERGGRTRFLREALQPVVIRGERSRQNLDRNDPIEPSILGAIDFTHSTGADRRKNFVGT